MTRTLLIGATLLLAAPAAIGQDMPLRDFIKEDAGWRTLTRGTPPTSNPVDAPASPAGKALVAARSPHDGTLYVGYENATHVWAFRDGVAMGQPYCPLRVPVKPNPRGGRPIKQTTSVTSLSFDVTGRIYAATPLGVQVYDPTGRLCGVLTPAAAGTPMHLGWEGEKNDMLTVWIGNQKFGRPMNTKGVK